MVLCAVFSAMAPAADVDIHVYMYIHEHIGLVFEAFKHCRLHCYYSRVDTCHSLKEHCLEIFDLVFFLNQRTSPCPVKHA
jgi:hypothetical protein